MCIALKKYLALSALSALVLTTLAPVTSFAGDPVGYEKTPVHERHHPDFTPQKIHVGSFIVMPILETQIEYDSNIFLDETGEVSDMVAKFKPSLTFKSDFGRHALNLDVRAEQKSYFDETDQNTTDLRGTLDGELDILDRLSGAFSFSAMREHEDRSDATTAASAYEPIEVNSHTAKIGLTYRPNRVSASLFGTYNRQTYENGTTRTTRANLLQEDRDKDSVTAAIKIAYEHTPSFSPYFTLSATHDRYDHRAAFVGAVQDQKIYSFSPGLSFNFKDILMGRVQAGIGRQDKEEPGIEDKTTYLVDTDVTWAATPLTTAVFKLNRFFDTDSNLNSGLVETRANVQLHHELKRNFILGTGLSAKWREFEGAGRRDKIYSFNIDGTYQINQHFGIKGGYIINKRLSNNIGLDYDQNIISLSLTGRF